MCFHAFHFSAFPVRARARVRTVRFFLLDKPNAIGYYITRDFGTGLA